MASLSLPISRAVSLQCYMRTFFIGAAMTTRGMQHLGLLYALDPGLVALHKDAQSLEEARERALPHCNSHAVMMPLLVALVLHLESMIAAKTLTPSQARELSQTTFSTLSALGDTFFSGSLLTLWALFAVLCVIHGLPWFAVAWTCFLLLSLQTFRILTFFMALRQGLSALLYVRRWNLIQWSQRIKMVNALFVTCVLYSVASEAMQPSVLLWGSVVWLLCGALLVAFCRVPRLFLVFFVALTLCFA